VTVAGLRVVSYNVHGLRDDLGALVAVIRELNPDVLVLQEAPRRFRWRARCARLARDVGLVYAVGGLPALGNLILTNLRVRVHDTWCLQFPLTPGRHMRGAAFARCSVARTPFVVVGSHLSTDPAERPGQAAQLKAAMSDVDVPLVLGADLNDYSGSAAWRTLVDGMTDAAVSARRTDAPTFPSYAPQHRIDALFVGGGIAVRTYDVLDTPVTRRASDHFPVVADLELPVG
jgi:endonuclease/exonuclease/phosphatase family metal-dependent hydrolase